MRQFVCKAGLLTPGEEFHAGVDDTWLASARRGRVLTNKRLFRYQDRDAVDLVALDDVQRVIVRRMWYPGAGPAGRGEVFGNGPVLILRYRFRARNGTTTRARFQSYAATLLPLVRAIAERFTGAVEVARTLPGL